MLVQVRHAPAHPRAIYTSIGLEAQQAGRHASVLPAGRAQRACVPGAPGSRSGVTRHSTVAQGSMRAPSSATNAWMVNSPAPAAASHSAACLSMVFTSAAGPAARQPRRLLSSVSAARSADCIQARVSLSVGCQHVNGAPPAVSRLLQSRTAAQAPP